MTTTVHNTTDTQWEYLQNVQNIVLVAREGGVSRAVIELCPRAGFRLTDCRDGSVETFMSLDEAKQAYARRR